MAPFLILAVGLLAGLVAIVVFVTAGNAFAAAISGVGAGLNGGMLLARLAER